MADSSLMGIIVKQQAAAIATGMVEATRKAREELISRSGEREAYVLINEMVSIMRQIDTASGGHLIVAMLELSAIGVLKQFFPGEGEKTGPGKGD